MKRSAPKPGRASNSEACVMKVFGGRYGGVAPALANAIARACGARVRDLPMTPARVWRALSD